MKKSVIMGIAAALFGLCSIGQVANAADNWPKGKKITSIVPWKAGGSADTMARQLIKYWEPLLDTNIIVSNREGAATLLGTELFLKQPKDGSNIYIGTQMYMSAGIVLQDA